MYDTERIITGNSTYSNLNIVTFLQVQSGKWLETLINNCY